MEYQRKPINIPGLERWEVDTEGTVYNLNGTPRKYSINHNGYCIVSFVTKDKKRISVAVHTIVAKTFLPKPSEDCWQVNHKNGNKTKNNVENLEWVTPVENVHHSINVLGNDQTGANNVNARKVIARDKKTGELKYQFDSLMDAAKFFTQEGKNQEEYKQLFGRCYKNDMVKNPIVVVLGSMLMIKLSTGHLKKMY